MYIVEQESLHLQQYKEDEWSHLWKTDLTSEFYTSFEFCLYYTVNDFPEFKKWKKEKRKKVVF